MLCRLSVHIRAAVPGPVALLRMQFPANPPGRAVQGSTGVCAPATLVRDLAGVLTPGLCQQQPLTIVAFGGRESKASTRIREISPLFLIVFQINKYLKTRMTVSVL